MISAEQIATFSEIGGRKDNQDSITYKIYDDDKAVFAVCDGVGGGPSGKLASQTACENTIAFFDGLYKTGNSFIESSIHKFAKELSINIDENNVLNGGATTLVLCVIESGKALFIHAGDSRIYLFRNGKVLHETKDHSVVQSMIDTGVLSAEEAHRHPMRNQITKAIVYGNELPDFEISNVIDLEKNDRILLTTDGVHGHYKIEDMEMRFSNDFTLPQIQNAFKNHLFKLNGDNYSAIIFQYN